MKIQKRKSKTTGKREDDIAIVVLGGGLIKDKSGKWRTTNFNEGDNFGVSGDRLRVLAASYLYKDNPRIIIVSGGRGQLSNIPNAPTIAEVLKKELIDLGVPASEIIEEDNSDNTWQQLQKLKKIIDKMQLRDVTVISNKWHLPRIKELIKKDRKLTSLFSDKAIKLISAERIVIRDNPKKWKGAIKLAYNSEAMKDRIKREKKGIGEIKKGTYKLN